MKVVKLLPLAVMAALGYNQRQTFGKLGETAINLAKVAVADHELSTIRTAVASEHASGDMREVKSDFSAFVRRIAKSDVRDPAEDPWGQPYAFRVRARRYDVLSFGPDAREGTDDDIVVGVDRR